MNENPIDPNEIGAAWIKQGQKGEYLTGKINGQPFVAFKNDRKTGNQPDWRFLKPTKKEDRPARPNYRTQDGDVGF